MHVFARTRSKSLAGTALTAVLLLAGANAQEPAGNGADRVDFSRDIRPILSNSCFRCHGPAERDRKAKLRLDTKQGVLARREGGTFAIVPGKPDASEVFRRITSTDPDEVMPPPKTKKELTARQIGLIKRWIEQGAPWARHWSLVPAKRPALPRVKDARWPRSDLDRFILARMEKEGLKPSPEADRRTLIRRVTFDLTGLPPTPEEVEAFMRDASPKAYDKLVDRLLSSTRYGEHMGRFWLDAARYGDTHGLHLDNYREMWPYRDWVVNAFNRNLPFDRFVIEQLAGDLLPNATLDQKVASGFNRCHVTTNEGGSIKEEVYVRNVVDRVSTTGTVFMGLTLECSRCHDHKYDPFTMKDFYSLFAFFNSLDGNAMDGNRKNHAPIEKVPSKAQREKLAALARKITEIESRMNRPAPDLDVAQVAWEKKVGEKMAGRWVVLDPGAFASTSGTQLKKLGDGSILCAGPNPAKDSYTLTARTGNNAVTAIRLEALRHKSLPHGGTGRASNANFVLSEFEAEVVSIEDPKKTRKIKFVSAQADYSQKDYEIEKAIDGKANTGWAVDGQKKREDRSAVFYPSGPVGFKGGTELRIRMRFEYGSSHAIGRFRLSVSNDADVAKATSPTKLHPWHTVGPFKAADAQEAYRKAWPPEQEADLSKTYQGGKLKWAERKDWKDAKNIKVDGRYAARYLLRKIEAPTAREIRFAFDGNGLVSAWLNGEWFFGKEGQRREEAGVWLKAGENVLLVKVCNGRYPSTLKFEKKQEQLGLLPPNVAQALRKRREKRNAAQRTVLRRYYRRGHSTEWRKLDARRTAKRREKTRIETMLPSTLIYRELAKPRPAYMLERGEYDKRKKEVKRATPASLPPMDPSLPKNRLGLAKWLLDPGHPLTARVAVNRYWQQLFGIGIVKTSEDFGSQGEPPSHPALLDYLATRFIADGWDVRKFMKLLVTSATYRQATASTPELLERDPENRLLARGPRFRLDAEMLRDQALAMGGLLVEKLGGPSVKPPQPDGLWFAVGYSGSNTVRFKKDVGPDKVYRRSLYTFWKRTAPPPQMNAFDAPSREACMLQRERTNTPLQALLLMNDSQYVEAARGLAQRILREGGKTPEARAQWVFRTATARPASRDELAVLVAAFRDHLETYRRSPDAAKKLIAVGESKPDASLDPVELAAWTMLSNLILNLDEVINKG